MIILRATGDLIRVVTGLGGASVECHASAIEVDNATPPVVQDIVRTNTAAIATATTTTILDCATANRRRRVMFLSIRNDAASATETVEVQHTDGTNVETLMKATLLAGETLVYNGSTWLHYDSNGGLYPSVGNAATQSEMEAGTATNKYVTPQGVNWHPGVAKFWVVFTGNSTTILNSWNMTSITDGTNQATVTIATDFSTANWCCQATAEGTTNTVAAARLASCHTIAVGAINVFCVDGAATTALQDPTRWHVAGYGDQ